MTDILEMTLPIYSSREFLCVTSKSQSKMLQGLNIIITIIIAYHIKEYEVFCNSQFPIQNSQ
jgi:hypothetical protein